MIGSKEAAMKIADLYETDETAWLERMSKLIEERRYKELDYKHLSEYLLDMAKRDRREVSCRLKTLLMHLLKWDYQPRKRSRSWEVTIMNQRYELAEELESQTLKNHALDVLPKAYAQAVKLAAKETGLSSEKFPEQCPYTLDDVLSEE
jgi:hypothetical protein